jgi:hypothetical protein
VETTTPWKQPTVDVFEKWLEKFKLYIHVHSIEIDVYVCGKFIEKIEDTWDIDVILSHRNLWSFDKEQILKIRDLMIYGMQMGHDEFSILVDLQCYLPNPDLWRGFWYSAEDYLRNGRIQAKKMLVFMDEYFNDEKINEYENVSELEENCYIITVDCPSDKHVQRIQNGEKYSRPVLLYEDLVRSRQLPALDPPQFTRT